jgi:hypothetical protein
MGRVRIYDYGCQSARSSFFPPGASNILGTTLVWLHLYCILALSWWAKRI